MEVDGLQPAAARLPQHLDAASRRAHPAGRLRPPRRLADAQRDRPRRSSRRPTCTRGRGPTITAAPARMQYGTPFTVDTPDADSIAKVTPDPHRLGHARPEHGSALTWRPRSPKQNGKPRHRRARELEPGPTPASTTSSWVNGNGVPLRGGDSCRCSTSDDTVAPSAPTGLTAAGATGKVTLNWTASTDNVAVHRSTTSTARPPRASRRATSTLGGDRRRVDP